MIARISVLSILVVALYGAIGAAQPYTIDWHTVDGGGGTSAGGTYELSGSIGQPDAGPGTTGMSGGTFELVGGFWPATLICHCPGDMNGDGLLDGRDVQKFIECLTASPGNCSCADVDRASGVNLDDIVDFVADLLASAACS